MYFTALYGITRSTISQENPNYYKLNNLFIQNCKIINCFQHYVYLLLCVDYIFYFVAEAEII